MPYPNKSESKESYIERFMKSKEANKDYPDTKQRYAVAQSIWKHKNKSLSASEIDMTHRLSIGGDTSMM